MGSNLRGTVNEHTHSVNEMEGAQLNNFTNFARESLGGGDNLSAGSSLGFSSFGPIQNNIRRAANCSAQLLAGSAKEVQVPSGDIKEKQQLMGFQDASSQMKTVDKDNAEK